MAQPYVRPDVAAFPAYGNANPGPTLAEARA